MKNQTNESYSIFRDYTQNGLPLLTPLKRTRSHIVTITTNPGIARDMDDTDFYLKTSRDTDKESRQLRFLRAIHISTPSVIATRREESMTTLATNFSGVPLQEWLPTSGQEKRTHMFVLLGKWLRDTQNRLQVAPLAPEWFFHSYQISSHIVDSFFYKFVNEVSPDDYVAHKVNSLSGNSLSLRRDTNRFEITRDRLRGGFIQGKEELPEHLQILAGHISNIADTYLARLSPYVYYSSPEGGQQTTDNKGKGPFLGIGDPDVIYGDFKPENLLIDETKSRVALKAIDPVITRGSRYFDLAKFISRYCLETTEIENITHLKPLLKAYGEIPFGRMPVYGSLTFVDLVLLDRLNILRSYLKRYIAGDKKYRLVSQLDNTEYVEKLTQQLALLVASASTNSLDIFLNGGLSNASKT